MTTLSGLGLVIMALALFGLGIITGYALASMRARMEGGGRTPAELKQDFDEYQDRVDTHFAKTNALFARMTAQYREIYAHMSSGAQDLCRDADARFDDHLALDAPAADPRIEAAREDGAADAVAASVLGAVAVAEPDSEQHAESTTAANGATADGSLPAEAARGADAGALGDVAGAEPVEAPADSAAGALDAAADADGEQDTDVAAMEAGRTDDVSSGDPATAAGIVDAGGPDTPVSDEAEAAGDTIEAPRGDALASASGWSRDDAATGATSEPGARAA